MSRHGAKTYPTLQKVSPHARRLIKSHPIAQTSREERPSPLYWVGSLSDLHSCNEDVSSAWRMAPEDHRMGARIVSSPAISGLKHECA